MISLPEAKSIPARLKMSASEISCIRTYPRPSASSLTRVGSTITHHQLTHEEPEIEGAGVDQQALQNVRVPAEVDAAHATGFPNDVVARLRFVSRDPSAYGTLSLAVRELHRIDASDARASLTVAPTVVAR